MPWVLLVPRLHPNRPFCPTSGGGHNVAGLFRARPVLPLRLGGALPPAHLNGRFSTDWVPTPTVLGRLPIAFQTSALTTPSDRSPRAPVADSSCLSWV